MSCKRIYISGRVQGVFFRDSTRQTATRLGLRGGVRNLRDGRVEVQACGDEESMERLLKWLQIGPKMAKVSTIDSIEITDSEADMLQPGAGFRVWPDSDISNHSG